VQRFQGLRGSLKGFNIRARGATPGTDSQKKFTPERVAQKTKVKAKESEVLTEAYIATAVFRFKFPKKSDTVRYFNLLSGIFTDKLLCVSAAQL